MDQSPPGIPDSEAGFFPRLGAALFGAKAKRLREQASRSHLLSYLLIIAQSITTVLVFGLSEVVQALTGAMVARIIAAGALGLLIITVFASDIALLDTLKRIPPLARNRQHAQNTEHILYVLFVLLVEGVTYGIVLYTLDSDPRRFTSGQSLIPNAGPWFMALVVLRVMLICWSAVQLFIVRSKLPVLLSTLMNTGKEIVGGHVEEQLKTLQVAHIPVRATFGVYARMSEAPRPVPGVLNALTGGWIVKRALAREAEEARQAQNISSALAELDAFTPASSATSATSASPASPSRALTPAQMGIAAENTVHLQPPLQPAAFAQGVTRPHRALSKREQARAQLEHDMLYGVRGHVTTPRGALLDDEGDADEYDLSDLSDLSDLPEDWQDEDASMLRAGRLPEMSQRVGPKRERAQAARIAPRGAELAVREFAMPDLPPSRYEEADDSDQCRAVFRVLDADDTLTNEEVRDRAHVSLGTVKVYRPLWKERHKNSAKGKKRGAPKTREIPAITPDMLASTR